MHIKLEEATWSQNAATALQTTPGCVMPLFQRVFWNCTEISILLSGQEFCSIKVKILPSFAIMCALRTNLCKFFLCYRR